MAVDIYTPKAQDAVSLDELRLYHRIMDYRAEKGLDAIPLSKALTTTAGRHVVDTRNNIWGEGVDLPSGANLHSWSDATYYADGRAPEAMWEAPERLGTGYGSAGYEITGAGYSSGAAALEGWKDSDAHNDILTNQGGWSSVDYAAIGIGLDTSSGPGPYAGRIFHVWFGATPDAAGPPTIVGGGDGERIDATRFADIVEAGGGADTVEGGSGGDTLRGGDGGDVLRGGEGGDRLSGEDGDDTLAGGNGGDRIYGGDGDDRLLGKADDDRLSGGSGADELSGSGGRDTLFGGDGADTLRGGAAADALNGGDGRDVFVFEEAADSRRSLPDEILDFTPGRDHIRLTDFDANTSRGGEQSFDYIGSADFSGAAGELRAAYGFIAGDVNGDGSTDFRVDVGDDGVSRADLWL